MTECLFGATGQCPFYKERSQAERDRADAMARAIARDALQEGGVYRPRFTKETRTVGLNGRVEKTTEPDVLRWLEHLEAERIIPHALVERYVNRMHLEQLANGTY